MKLTSSSAIAASAQASIDVDKLVRCGCGDPDTHNGSRCRHEPDERCDYCFRPCPRPCGCGDPASHNGADYPYKRPCPRPREAGFQGEHLGSVGFTHRSQMVRWADTILRGTGHRYTLWVVRERSLKVIENSVAAAMSRQAFRVKLALCLIAMSGHRVNQFWISPERDAHIVRRDFKS